MKSLPYRLIIFTHYPEPGKAKPRLIPTLGPEGAADLQRKMTEYTLKHAHQLSMHRSVSVDVRFEGSNKDLMQEWLGRDVICTPQGIGDLGKRMSNALHDAFDDGIKAAVIIWADCPRISVPLLKKAFDILREKDVVIGPSLDGCYYLIGMRKYTPDLFVDIAWGNGEVFKKTIQISDRLGLSVGLVEPLDNVDYPDDLHIWDEVSATETKIAISPQISIIIPTINDADNIEKTLASIRNAPNTEVIVVDGGSKDGTIKKAKARGAAIINSLPHRAKQMNAGARAAKGDILLFLHADTQLPERFDEEIRTLTALPNTAMAAFRLKIEGASLRLKIIERLINWRSKKMHMPSGDQAIFIRADLFHEIGGFPEIPIKEDYEIVKRLKKMGNVRISSSAVTTSNFTQQATPIM